MLARAQFSQPTGSNAHLVAQRRSKTTIRSTTALVSGLFFAWLFLHYVMQPAWLMALPGGLREALLLVELAGMVTILALWLLVIWQTWKTYEPETLHVLQIDELNALSPDQFEHYVADVFRAKGYKVKVRGGTGDLGVDLEVFAAPGKKAVVQCKRYQSTVGAKTVRELYGTLRHERAAHAFLVTSAEISSSARSWAREKPLTLIDGTTLVSIAAALAAKQ
jgi:restriction system protein